MTKTILELYNDLPIAEQEYYKERFSDNFYNTKLIDLQFFTKNELYEVFALYSTIFDPYSGVYNFRLKLFINKYLIAYLAI